MSTGSVPDDATSICSVCLEPYQGRSPKLLPCFHTFCLPCLKDLEEHYMALADSKVCEEDGSKKPLAFPCPTCRADITVPAGGVTQFQTNFYLSDKIMACDVCDRGQEAACSCADCGHSMCDECQQWHDKFLSNHKMQLLTSSCQQSSNNSLTPGCLEQLDKHLVVLEAALVTMREEEDSLQRERQAVADVISRRADAVRAMVAQAEERTQRALAEVAETLGKHIQDEITTARDKHARIWQLSSQRGIKEQVTLAFRHGQKDLLSDEDLLYYQQRGSRRRLLHQFNDCAIYLQAVESYLGMVCGDEQLTGDTSSIVLSATVSSDIKDTEITVCDTNATSQPSDTTVLTKDVADINHRLQMLETLVGSGCKHTDEMDIEKFKQEISELQTLVAALQEKIFSIQQSVITSKDISSLQEDMTSLQEKLRVENTMLQKDISTIHEVCSEHSSEIKNFQCDFEKLVKDLKSFKEKSCNMVAFHAELKDDIEINRGWQPLILNNDRYNEGQAYDTKTGVFTVPVTGTYFFMARAQRTQGTGYCVLMISAEGSNCVYSLSNIGELQAGVGCTAHVVWRLTQGQRVSLSVYCDTTLSRDSTCFSGMLVRPEVELA